MSQENVEMEPSVPGRSPLERIAVHVPAAATVFAAMVSRTRPGSPLRRRLATWMVARGFAAMARSDVEVQLLVYEPDAEVWHTGMEGVGVGGCFRGHHAIRALSADMDEAWRDWRLIICAVVDGGDRFAVRGDFVGQGRSSGVETRVPNCGTAIRLSKRGKVAWQVWFAEANGWQKSLEAAGLSE